MNESDESHPNFVRLLHRFELLKIGVDEFGEVTDMGYTPWLKNAAFLFCNNLVKHQVVLIIFGCATFLGNLGSV